MSNQDDSSCLLLLAVVCADVSVCSFSLLQETALDKPFTAVVIVVCSQLALNKV